MFKALPAFICSIFCLHSFAQDTIRKPILVGLSYSIGIQTFRLNSVENHVHERLERNMPSQGEIEKVKFSPTIVNQLSLSSFLFKNKEWLIQVSAVWGTNNLTTHASSFDTLGRRYALKADANFKFLYTGYSISKKIAMGKWGALYPFIGFYMNWRTPYSIDVNYDVYSKSTNEKLAWGKGIGGSGDIYKYGSPYLLWFFDNPKIGLNYSVRLFSHVNLNLSYSYWLANSYLNEMYSLSGYIFKPKNMRVTTKNQSSRHDLYSHNVSIGIQLHLYD